MLLFDVTFDTGEEIKIGRKHRTWYSRRKIECSRGMVNKWRDLFQETNYFDYCSESRKFLILLEKVYTFKSLRFCGIDYQRSIDPSPKWRPKI